MKSSNLGEIKAVAFDIDGTLYRSWKLNIRIAAHCVRYNQFFLKYGIVRKVIRKIHYRSNFNDFQAELMAIKLGCTPNEALQMLDKVVYSGLAKYFKRIKPCHGVVELITDLKKSGYKIGILSDFPPEQKGDIWGIKPLCDVTLGTEEAGALKPSMIPFLTLSRKLQVPPEQILYVGNNHKYDVMGAKQVGMKTAWFRLPLAGIFGRKSKEAEITFWSYNQLRKYLLDDIEK